MEAAHKGGLIHGQLDLSKIVLHFGKEKTMECKITDFKPGSSKKIPTSTEANYWPFNRNKKNMS